MCIYCILSHLQWFIQGCRQEFCPPERVLVWALNYFLQPAGIFVGHPQPSAPLINTFHLDSGGSALSAPSRNMLISPRMMMYCGRKDMGDVLKNNVEFMG